MSLTAFTRFQQAIVLPTYEGILFLSFFPFDVRRAFVLNLFVPKLFSKLGEILDFLIRPFFIFSLYVTKFGSKRAIMIGYTVYNGRKSLLVNRKEKLSWGRCVKCLDPHHFWKRTYL